MLDKLDTKWNFRKETVWIKNKPILLTSPTESNNDGHISSVRKSIKEHDGMEVKLYAKNRTIIPPYSSAIIQLKASKEDYEPLPDEVLIQADQKFRNNKNSEAGGLNGSSPSNISVDRRTYPSGAN